MGAMERQAQRAPVTADDFEVSPVVEQMMADFASANGQAAPDEKARIVATLCRALRLNPLTQPIQWIRLNGKDTLYVTKVATDQLAAINNLRRDTTRGPEVVDVAGTKVVLCQVRATLPSGRSEVATATLPLQDPVNVLMKCETKAKRRATLSILGLGLLVEEELDTIPGVRDPRTVETIPAPEPTEDRAEDASRAVVEMEAELDYAKLADVPATWKRALEGLRGEGHAPEEWTATLAQELDAWLVARGVHTLSAADKTALCAGTMPPDLADWHDTLAALLPLDGRDRVLSSEDAARKAAETWLASRWSSLPTDAAGPYRVALQRWMAHVNGTPSDVRGAGQLLASAVQRLRAERAAAVDALTAAPSTPTRAREPGDDDDEPPNTPTPRTRRRKATDATPATADDTSWQGSAEGMRAHAAGLEHPRAIEASARKHCSLVGYAAVLAERLVALTPPDEHGACLSESSARARVNGWMASAQAAARRAA